jgi:uncharacterized protein YjbJ (UPF0337 family)
MGEGTFDKAEGQAEEVVGDLTGDEDLQAQGEIDQASGSLKDKAAELADKVKDTATSLVDKVREAVGRDR